MDKLPPPKIPWNHYYPRGIAVDPNYMWKVWNHQLVFECDVILAERDDVYCVFIDDLMNPLIWYVATSLYEAQALLDRVCVDPTWCRRQRCLRCRLVTQNDEIAVSNFTSCICSDET